MDKNEKSIKEGLIKYCEDWTTFETKDNPLCRVYQTKKITPTKELDEFFETHFHNWRKVEQDDFSDSCVYRGILKL